MSSHLPLRDALRRELFLLQLDLFLQDIPGKHRRAVRTELRAALDAAAADTGMRRAIADLGTPAALAARYRDAEPGRRPRWWTGIAWFSVVATGWLVVALAYAVGLMDAAHQLDVAQTEAVTLRGSPLGLHVTATVDPDGIALAISNMQLWLIGSVVVLLVTARAWRALPWPARRGQRWADAARP